jgi:hypothetical protein
MMRLIAADFGLWLCPVSTIAADGLVKGADTKAFGAHVAN